MSADWRDPGVHEGRRGRLLARARIRDALRGWFQRAGFVEVECGALQASPGAGAHLHGMGVVVTGPDGAPAPRFLHTSPEFAMKGLLAAGETRIVDFARAYRDRERGPLHAPEFTLIEWYRAQAPMEAVVADCRAVIAAAAETAGTIGFSWRGRMCDPRAPADEISCQDAFARYADVDLLATVSREGAGDRGALAAQARAAGIAAAGDDDWSDLFARILVERVEPQLGLGRVTVLSGYPAPEAALAERDVDDPRVARRFEVYACGVELANGFQELTDAEEQRRRLDAEHAEALRRYGRAAPIDPAFLKSVARMPAAAGVALGFDRLAMLATGAGRVDDVIWTPFV